MGSSDLLNDPEAMYSALWVAVGVMLLFVARRTYGALFEGDLAGVVMVTQLFITGIGIVLLATWEPVDLRRISLPLVVWTVWTLLAVAFYNFLLLPPDFFGSDVSLFESYAAHLVTQGEHPMAHSMLDAREVWPISNASANITATTTGGVVSQYSYPGGTLWSSTLEAALTPYNRLGIATVLASTTFLAWLLARVDVGLEPLVLLVWMVPIVRPVSASLGMITPLWLFPLAVGLAAWYDGRLDAAALALGVAVASKQLAWPIAGLVAVHVLRTRSPRTGGRFLALAGAATAVLVAPFALWNPQAWATSALFPFLPIGDPLVAQGVGLTSLTVSGVFEVPRTFHRVLVVGMGAALIGATWRWPDRMRWVIPFATILTMLVHYRTLPSYYAATVPLAVVALDARFRGREETPRPTLFFDRLIKRVQIAGDAVPEDSKFAEAYRRGRK